MALTAYKQDIGAFQFHRPGKDRTKEPKQNIGADPGDSGKPVDTLILSARKGSYTMAEGISKRQLTV